MTDHRTKLQQAGRNAARVAVTADLRADLRADLLENAADLYRASTWVPGEADDE